ncbi:MAG: hypothetical protein HRT88_16160, partial [Lentisphaeraceae bacterium]|nr:hypothetical protein [Lentisphaeraceae bacterium]
THKRNHSRTLKIDESSGIFSAFSPSHLEFVVPPGNWKLQGLIRAQENTAMQMTINVLPKAQVPKALKAYTKTIEFKIPKIGSFGDTFDPNCEKVRHYSAMLAHRLAVQQCPDGSWPKVKSYTPPGFYTAMCGLALMSTGDPSYKEHIKKAAYYVAHCGKNSIFSYPRGLTAWFVGEYYLRTQDKGILPAYSAILKRGESNLVVGPIAGHKVRPGYSGDGWIGGSGVIATAFAIAEHTPVKFARGTAAKMLKCIQSISDQGSTPYGRTAGKGRFDLNSFWRGQSSCAGTGPYFIATKINGGSKFFHDVTTRRFTTAPYGDVDFGHATHTLPFIFGSVAISLCGEEYHRANMESFLWKLTTHRGFDGLIVSNANPLEYHTGEIIMGKPWFSTGAWLFLLNAHKRNLASTGKKQYMAKQHKKLLPVSGTDMSVWRQTLRQWSVVQATMGKRTPHSVKRVIKALVSLKKDENLGDNIFKLMSKYAIPAARAIAASRFKDSLQKNYCMEIVLGVCHDVYLDIPNWKQPKFRKENEKNLQLRLQSNNFFSRCKRTLHGAQHAENPVENLSYKGTVRITDARNRPLKGLPKVIELTHPELTHSRRKKPGQLFTFPDVGKTKIFAHFSYTCGGIKINYKKELKVNRDNRDSSHMNNLRKLWVPGTLVKSFDTWNLHFRLPNSTIYHGSPNRYQLLSYDMKGTLLPTKDSKWQGKIYHASLVYYLTKGSKIRALVSIGPQWEGLVHAIRVEKPGDSILRPSSIEVLSGGSKGYLINTYDMNANTANRITTDDKGEFSFVVNFKKQVKPVDFYYTRNGGGNFFSYKIEAMTTSGWRAFHWSDMNFVQNLDTLADCPESNKFRITLTGEPNKWVDLFEIAFIK